MALVVKDRVRETSTTTGTGTFTLAGAVAGFQSFTAIGTGNTTYYTIVMSGDWEVGLGTWTSPDQLSRDTVLASSNAGALVPFGSGTKDVFCTFPAEGFALPPAIGGTTPNTITGTTVTANTAINLPAVINTGITTGVIKMVDGGDGYDYLNLYTWDGSIKYPVNFPGGGTFVGPLGTTGDIFSGNVIYVQGNGTISGNIRLREASNIGDIKITVPTTLATTYTLTLPSTSGSNNQVLKTDGTGVTSWTDKFILGAGTATVAPLQLTSGTNLTTAAAGAIEYNGTAAFITGTAASGRGINLAPQMVRVNTDRAKATNNTTLEPVFDAANDVLALAANTLYYFKGVYVVTKSATGTAGGVQVGFAFSNAQQEIGYKSIGFTATSGTAQTTIYNTVVTAVTATATATAATDYVVEIEGWFKSNATTGGTLTPQFTQSVVGTTVAPTMKANSWFMVQPMSGTPTTTLIAGNWS